MLEVGRGEGVSTMMEKIPSNKRIVVAKLLIVTCNGG